MAKYATLVQETSATTGTADLVLAGATTQHRTLAAAFSANDWVNYLVQDADGVAFEREYGKFNGTTGLTRFVVKESSAAGSKITLSSGIHIVSITPHPGMVEFQGYIVSVGSDMSIADSTQLQVAFDSVNIDTDSVITTTPWQDVMPVPDYIDRVVITARINFENAGSGWLKVQVLENTGTFAAGLPNARMDTDGTGEDKQFPLISAPVQAKDWLGTRGFNIYAYHEMGVTAKIYNSSWFCVEYLS